MEERNMAGMRVGQVRRPNGPFEILERPIPDLGSATVRIKLVLDGNPFAWVQAAWCQVAGKDDSDRRSRIRSGLKPEEDPPPFQEPDGQVLQSEAEGGAGQGHGPAPAVGPR